MSDFLRGFFSPAFFFSSLAPKNSKNHPNGWPFCYKPIGYKGAYYNYAVLICGLAIPLQYGYELLHQGLLLEQVLIALLSQR
jgi:hypothetical protein